MHTNSVHRIVGFYIPYHFSFLPSFSLIPSLFRLSCLFYCVQVLCVNETIIQLYFGLCSQFARSHCLPYFREFVSISFILSQFETTFVTDNHNFHQFQIHHTKTHAHMNVFVRRLLQADIENAIHAYVSQKFFRINSIKCWWTPIKILKFKIKQIAKNWTHLIFDNPKWFKNYLYTLKVMNVPFLNVSEMNEK